MVRVNEIKEHFLAIGNYDVLKEIEKLETKEMMIVTRNRKYHKLLENFAQNFGAYSVGKWTNSYVLYFIEHSPKYEELARNINVTGGISETYDEDGNEEDTNMVVPKRWFDDIQHLWINKYKDQNFDIFQSRLI